MKEKPVIDITDWQIDPFNSVLWGVAKGHPRLGDGPVRTSSIVKVDLEARIVETRNSVYRLIGPEYDPTQELVPWAPAAQYGLVTGRPYSWAV